MSKHDFSGNKYARFLTRSMTDIHLLWTNEITAGHPDYGLLYPTHWVVYIPITLKIELVECIFSSVLRIYIWCVAVGVTNLCTL